MAVAFAPLAVSRDFIDYPYFADLGAVQAAAVVRDAGHDVTLVDAFALPGAGLAEDPSSSNRVRLGASVDEVLERLPSSLDALVVALTPFHRPPARDGDLGALLSGVRASNPALPIVLADLYQSGQHVVDAPADEVARAYPEADVYLRYEAEGVLAQLLEELWTTPAPRGRVVNGQDAPSLDALPLPAWDLVDIDAYFAFHTDVMRRLGRAGWAFPIDENSAPIVTSRGCPFRCVHCSSNPSARRNGELVRPKTQRRCSAAYLDRALSALRARGVRRVHVLDELANVNEAHFDALLELLGRHDLSFEIPNGLRADYVLDRHLAAVRGRVTTLSVSAESGVQRVVDEVVDKQLDLAAITSVAARARDAEVPLLIHFMIGLPGETKQEINATLQYALTLHEETGAWPAVQFATPLPGTRLAARAEKRPTALPVIRDFGPHFQHEPSIATSDFTLDDLRRFKWTFDRRIEASKGPKKVILNATYKCNNRCTFCATGTRTQVDGNFDRQRELLVKYRRTGVRLLDIDGGEPTLNPNLLPLVRFARTIGYERVNVTTNGRMSSYPEFASQLTRSGVTSVLVSIHGPDATTHAQNVGVAEAFDQTCAGARNLVSAAPAGVEIGANITLTKSNHGKLAKVGELVLSLGMRLLNVQFLTPFGRATRSVCPDTQAAADEVKRVIDELSPRLTVQVINLPFCFMPGYERYLAGDMLKLERHMLFVNNDEVNLFEYLRERRSYQPVCDGCPHRIFCGGFYELDDVPEPKWLVRAEDLVRPIGASVPGRAPR